ncbi:putative sugar O-methyltransferase [Micromonospora sp. CB01531]|uniref:putative sugar O-methyltransferase n=1 Tax=Micromonospora sp. CB01531 TaxID=1718947 RepID=UPI00093E00E5|nr:putative sugar O-methyltransferase [Micromonospora sp. CB01531]OKI62374.1 methyltransferase [Micromonospora sp. CB01531]
MREKYGPSQLRARHDKFHVTEAAATEISSFKSKPINFKIGYWDPRVNGVRYLKSLMYILADGLSDENWKRLRSIRNRTVGEPITITFDGEPVCMDYLQSVLELDFIAGNVELEGTRVLEIGAGYGRTCHTILSNHDVREYHIIDLPNSLTLSTRYLRSVLDAEQFAKVRFTSIGDVDEQYTATDFDLTINISSFSEMTAETVDDYLAMIDARSRYFYIRDAVGKYLDSSLNGNSDGYEVVKLALSTGKLRDVIDIHDNRAVEAHVGAFVEAYRPGPRWTCVANAWARPWGHYWQALYGKDQIQRPVDEQLGLGSEICP